MCGARICSRFVVEALIGKRELRMGLGDIILPVLVLQRSDVSSGDKIRMELRILATLRAKLRPPAVMRNILA
jgi:hypothetical protein